MKAVISKSDICGQLIPPPSKSYTIRVLVATALARGESTIRHPLTSDDTEAAIGILDRVGVQISRETDQWKVSGGCYCSAQRQ